MIFLLMLSLLLTSCSRDLIPVPKPQGHIVGNGGDPLHNLFTQGKSHASRVLQRLQALEEARLKNYSGKDVEFLKGITPALLSTISESKHHWMSEMPEGCPKNHCGCTFPDRPRDVYLSLEECRQVNSTYLAGTVVLHEALHSTVQANEEDAKRLTALAYDIWTEIGGANGPETAQWEFVMVPGNIDFYGFKPQITKSGELLVGDFSNVAFFHAGTKQWRVETPKVAAYELLKPTMTFWEMYPHQHHWVSESALVLMNCPLDDFPFSGIGYDSTTNEYFGIPNHEVVTHRYGTLQVVTEEGLEVWGGHACGKTEQEFNDGALFDLKSKSWKPLTTKPTPVLSKVTSPTPPEAPEAMKNYLEDFIWTGAEFLALFDGRRHLGIYFP